MWRRYLVVGPLSVAAAAPLQWTTLGRLQADPPPPSTFEGTSVGQCSVSTYNANRYLEDRHFVTKSASVKGNKGLFAAVMDGHGGWQAAEFTRDFLPDKFDSELKALQAAAAKSPTKAKGKSDEPESLGMDPIKIGDALVRSFLATDEAFTELIRPAFNLGFGTLARVGCCVVAAAITDSHVVVANAGDCRAVVGRITDSSKPGEAIAIELSKDHNAKLPEEKAKLAAAHPNESNIVVCKHPDSCYVKGRLQPTRAIGDLRLKSAQFNVPPKQPHRGSHIPSPYTPPYITATPEVISHELDFASDSFLVLACDGIWDAMSSEDVVKFIASDTGDRETVAARLAQEVLAREAASAHMSVNQLMKMPPGHRRGYHDDLTVVVLYFNKAEPARKSWGWF